MIELIATGSVVLNLILLFHLSKITLLLNRFRVTMEMATTAVKIACASLVKLNAENEHLKELLAKK